MVLVGGSAVCGMEYVCDLDEWLLAMVGGCWRGFRGDNGCCGWVIGEGE